MKEAVAKVFESRVEQLLHGDPEQQQRGREIAELVKVRRTLDTPALIVHPDLKKQLPPPLNPAEKPDPAPKHRRRGHHF